MTPQMQADAALQVWQEYRALPPDDRIEILVATFWLPPIESLNEYEITLSRVHEEMEDINA